MQVHAKPGWQQPKKKKRFGSHALQSLGRIGKALLFPIAVLPIAAIFLRLGSQIPGGTDFAKFIQSIFLVGGNVVFNNLYILFGIGVAFGLTKDNRGEAALVGFVGIIAISMLLGTANGGSDLTNQIYGKIEFNLPAVDALKSGQYGALPEALVNASDEEIITYFQSTLSGFHRIFGNKYDAILSTNVLNGIIAGGAVAFIYNRYNGVELPKVLGFFSGRRLVPVLGLIAVLVFGLVWVIIFPWIGWGLYEFSNVLSLATSDRYGKAAVSGVYVFLNRLLIPFGLHHIPNTVFWFVLGSHPVSDLPGAGTVYGDINIFLNGMALNNTAGAFQTGFFPTMMFGLPAMVWAFYKTAENKVQRQRVLSLFAPLALIAFLTGITEPIEFAFMFVSPLLYLVYAVVAGVFGFIINLFGIQIGFAFSAGLLDYLLSIPKSLEIIAVNKTGVDAVFANPGWLFPIGAIAAASFYYVSTWFIKKFNLATPGRGKNVIQDDANTMINVQTTGGSRLSPKAQMIVAGLGGWDNITNYQNCSTRLRYDVVDMGLVDEALIKKSGAMGFQKVGNQAQVIIGPSVEILNDEIEASKGSELTFNQATQTTTAPTKARTQSFKSFVFTAPVDGKIIDLSKIKDQSFSMMGQGLALVPTSGEFISNANQELELGFRTGHAFIVKHHGISIMMHIGLDTNKLLADERLTKEIFVSKFADAKNVPIKNKEVIVKVNLAKVKTLALDLTTPIVVLNETLGNHKVKLLVKNGQAVKQGDPLFEII